MVIYMRFRLIHRRNAPSNVRDMMLSQKIAPDLLDKGVHFNVGKIELKAVPDHLGEVTFKPVLLEWY